jgi:hypothetical protein
MAPRDAPVRADEVGANVASFRGWLPSASITQMSLGALSMSRPRMNTIRRPSGENCGLVLWAVECVSCPSRDPSARTE